MVASLVGFAMHVTFPTVQPALEGEQRCALHADIDGRTSVRFWQIGAALLFFLLFIFVLDVLLLALGSTLDRRGASAVILASAALSALAAQRLFLADWVYSLIIPGVMVVVSLLAEALIYDTSIDGQEYHFQAIYAYAHNWNPFWATGELPSIGDPAAVWARHYPAAGWLIQATLLRAGLPLEAAKGINLIAAISSVCILAGAVRSNIRVAALLVAAGGLNPVGLSELFTRMNDGMLACCIMIFVVSTAHWILFGSGAAFATAAAGMLIGLNLKFSAVLIFGVLSAAAVAGAYLCKGRGPAVQVAARLLATGMIGLLLLGANPYLLNLARYGHPFYPVMGVTNVNIMSTNMPEVIAPLSPPFRFLFSLFAETHSGYDHAAQLKWPLSMSWREVRAAGGVDVRIAGFGPLFSGAISLAVALLIVAAFRVSFSPKSRILLFLAASVLISALFMPQNWWARYVPQLWLVPLLISAALHMTDSPWLRKGAVAVIAIMAADASLVGAASLYLAAKRSTAVAAQIAELKRRPEPVCVSAELAQSRIAIFKAAGIDVRATPDPSCEAPMTIASYGPDRAGGAICPCK